MVVAAKSTMRLGSTRAAQKKAIEQERVLSDHRRLSSFLVDDRGSLPEVFPQLGMPPRMSKGIRMI